MKRRIKQLSATTYNNSAACYALCSDGSLWFHGFVKNGDEKTKYQWIKLSMPPQSAEADAKQEDSK